MYLIKIYDLLIIPFTVVLPVLICTAYFTLAERKTLASIQRRIGPNMVGAYGVLQPIADGIKLLSKECVLPLNSNKFVWCLLPFISLGFCFLGWFVINSNYTQILSSLNYGLLYSIIISGLNVYWIFLAGWFGKSQYSVFASIRSVSQLISYELVLSLLLVPLVAISGSLNLNFILYVQTTTVWFILPLLPNGILFFICILAESNRIPFDLLEAEAELVAGYYTDFGGFWFASFFLAEYANMLLASCLFVTLFLGGGGFYTGLISEFIFFLKTIFVSFFFIFIRANLPRYRYDQLLLLGWKILLPLSVGLLIFYVGLIFALGGNNLYAFPFMSTSYTQIFTYTVYY